MKIKKILHSLAHGVPIVGTLCLLDLKNAGATYQQVMKTIFHDMMHKNMEDYVDETLAKSKKRDTYLDDLEVILDHME